MNIRLASMSILDGDGENLRFKPRAAAHFAWLTGHERSDAIASKLALSFFIEPVHLRNQPFKRARRFAGATIPCETHLDWLIAGTKTERLLESLRQFGERHVFIDMKMFDERALQVAVVDLHSLCPAPPWRDRPFSEFFAGIGNHQIGIAN